jgi:2-phosphosulfolactate phosphatase
MQIRVLLVAPRPGGRTPGAALPAAGETAVVIDVLRATTTLTVALGNGARGLREAVTPEEAREIRASEPEALLCGEREGLKIEGFDLGNSPAEYEPAVVRDRTLIFASTNGSLALRAARSARRRVLAAFVNLAAVVERLAGDPRVAIVCAGKLGGFAIEDAACAGLLCRRLEARGARLEGAAARLAAALAPGGAADTRALVEGASHARYLRAMSPAFARDVARCAELDTIERAFEV